MNKSNPLAIATAICVLLLSLPAFSREKVDIIVMDNGDRITGEVTGLAQGILTVKTDNLGTLSIEWLHVASVSTPFVFQVEMADGRILLGGLAAAEQSKTVAIVTDGEPRLEARNDMVRMAPMQDRILDRFTGSVSAGVTYTKGTDQTQVNFSLSSMYFAEKFHASISASSLATFGGGEAESSARDTFNFTYRGLRPNRWFGAGILEAQRNDELDVDLRVSLGAGYGRYALQNQRLILALTGGIVATREWNVGENDETEDNLEAFFDVDHSYNVLDSPKVNLSNNLTIYPGLTNWGAFRADFDASLRWEMIKDLYWSLQLYGSYANEREENSAATTDYGFVTGLSYSF